MGSYYRQQVIIYQKVTHCWVTAKRKKREESVKTLSGGQRLFKRKPLKGTGWGRWWFPGLFFPMEILSYLFSTCRAACWWRAVKMLRTQKKEATKSSARWGYLRVLTAFHSLFLSFTTLLIHQQCSGKVNGQSIFYTWTSGHDECFSNIYHFSGAQTRAGFS